MRGPADYHIHTRYSDGSAWPEEYPDFARKAGLSEIGFADHLTLTEEPQGWSIDTDLLGEYCERIERLKKANADLIIRCGLEVDYFRGKEDEIRETIRGLPLDYLFGSVHYMGDGPVDLGPEYYDDKNHTQLFRDYFNMVVEAASTGLFDVMSHPDLVRIFGATAGDSAEELYTGFARRLKQYNVAIEINTNGKNKPLDSFYPDPGYLHLFIREGIPVCINSDAHKPENVGQHFYEAYRLFASAGGKQVAMFDKRRILYQPIR